MKFKEQLLLWMQWAYGLPHEYTLGVSASIAYSFINHDQFPEALSMLEKFLEIQRKTKLGSKK